MLLGARVVRIVATLSGAALLTGCCNFFAAADQAACNNAQKAIYQPPMDVDPDTLWLLGPGIPATAMVRIMAPLSEQLSYQLVVGKATGSPTILPLPSGLSVSLPATVSSRATALLTAEALSYNGTDNLVIVGRATSAGASIQSGGALVVTTVKAFTLAALSQGVTIQQGSVGAVPVAVSRARNFTGHVTLSGTATDPGIAAAVTPGPLPVVNGTATVSVGANVAPGQYNVVLRGAYRSFYDSLVVPVTVVVPPPPPDFRLSFAKNALTLDRGDSATTTLDITRAVPLIGAIQLLEQSPPAGVKISYSANPATGSVSDVTVGVTAAAIAGTYTFDIAGTWQSITRAASLTLTIKDPDYQLTATPTSQTVLRGSVATVTLGITSATPTIQLVQLSKQPEPTGITMTLPASLARGASIPVSINVASQVAAGTYTLRIIGDALGIKRSIDVTLTITDPTVSLTLSPTSLTLQAGGPANQTLLVISGLGQGYQQQSATVLFPNLPSGVTATVTPQNNYSSSNLIISLTASSGAKVGTFSTVVHVVIAGVTYPLPLTLTIQAPLTDFELVPPPDTTIVKRGAQKSSHSVTILRHASFAVVQITLSASGLPAGQGITAFSPNTAGGSVATLDIYASPNVPLGNYTLTLTGTGTSPSTNNAITRTAPMVVKVVP